MLKITALALILGFSSVPKEQNPTHTQIRSCKYEVGTCMYYMSCLKQWPPPGCTN